MERGNFIEWQVIFNCYGWYLSIKEKLYKYVNEKKEKFEQSLIE